MKSHFTIRTGLATIAMLAATSAFAAGPPGGVPVGPPAGIPHGPPPGVGNGPPAGIPKGPPAAATARIPAAATARMPQGNGAAKTAGKADHAADRLAHVPQDVQKGASLLKKLNAAHANERALERASEKSIVGAIAEYKEGTKQALEDIETYGKAVADGTEAVAGLQADVNAAQAKLDAAKAETPIDQVKVDAAQAELDAAKTQLASAQTALEADQARLAEAQTLLTSAQNTLADKSGVELTPEVVQRLNDLLKL